MINMEELREYYEENSYKYECLDCVFDKLDSFEKLEKDFVKEKIKEEEKDFLEKLSNYYKENRELFEDEFYWDYNDEYVSATKFLKKNSFDDFLDSCYEEIFCLNLEYGLDLRDNIINNVLNDIFDEKEYEFIEEEDMRSIVDEYISIDLNIERLLEKTEIRVNLFPYQKENFNTECSEMGEDVDYLTTKYVADGGRGYYRWEDEDKHEIQSKVLYELFKSQGYEFKDLEDGKSDFITSFTTELWNKNEDGLSGFVCMIKTNLLEFAEMYYENKKISYKGNGTGTGLFNPVYGSGSVLEVELEKPFEFNVGDCEFQIEECAQNYGYTVDSVYGLIDSCWTDNFEIIE